MSVFKAAVVQMRSGTDVSENIRTLEHLVREAAAAGADYVQTPEMTGLVQQSRRAFFESIASEADDLVKQAAARLAKELGIHLHIGSTPISVEDGRAANRAFFVLPDGSIAASYDKIHMFDVDLDNGESWRESAVYRPGNHAVTVDAMDTRFGLAICYDVRFPQLHTDYALRGADVLTCPSCFTRQTGQAHWHTLMRSRAVETGSFMISAAQGGEHEDGRTTFGHSIIVNPWGEVIAEVTGENPGFAMATIDTDEVKAARSKVPNLANRRVYSFIDSDQVEAVA